MADVSNDARRNVNWVGQEYAEETDRSELYGKSEAVVVTSTFRDELLVFSRFN